MNASPERYWFRARRYGWGWSLPLCWQGWLAIGAYFGLFVFGIVVLRDRQRPAEFIGFVSVITAVLLFVCWKKGEPARWRWGGE